jgi:glucose/arabinose dehydrogenase
MWSHIVSSVEAIMQTDRVRTVLVVLFLVSLFLGSLAGCGGGGGHPGNPDSPVKLQAVISGSLTVNMGSLPPGTGAAVHVTGPGNYAADLAGPQTLGGLEPGEYTITALPVVAGTTTLIPLPETQTVTVAAGATATASVNYAVPPAQLGLARVASGLAGPTWLTAPRNDERQFVTERAGRILVLRGGVPQVQAFLDLRALTDVSGEGGLLSMAFDPDYAANGRFYVYRTNASHDILVERYTVSGNPAVADPASRLEIIRIPHPQFTNHFGGQLAFGPDGYLSLGTGDGGGGGDPNGNAQNPNVLLGKLLRLDVSAASAAEPYRIPPTNPWPNQAGRRPEVWASGLRNPWRFSYDGNRLYIADVGQDAREEVDLVPSLLGGLNFGWNRMEATICYGSSDCDRSGLIYPVIAYAHTEAADSPCSVTGGFVYRGTAIPALAGHYFYSDFCGGFLRSFYATANGTLYAVRDWNIASPGRVVSFGQDGQGELYMLALDGSIWKIVPAS